MRRPTDAPATPISFERTADGSYELRALAADGVVSLGRHATVADVWRAIDELDAPVAFAHAA